MHARGDLHRRYLACYHMLRIMICFDTKSSSTFHPLLPFGLHAYAVHLLYYQEAFLQGAVRRLSSSVLQPYPGSLVTTDERHGFSMLTKIDTAIRGRR